MRLILFQEQQIKHLLLYLLKLTMIRSLMGIISGYKILKLQYWTELETLSLSKRNKGNRVTYFHEAIRR